MKKIINARAKGFIVPNKASKAKNYIFDSERLLDLAKINGVKNPDESKFSEIWIVSDDLRSNNVGDHGCKFVEDGKEYWVHYIDTHLPVDLFLGHKEGDVVKVIITGITDFYRLENSKEHSEIDPIKVEIHLDLELDQHEFRYRSFGTFEQVLEFVC